MNRAEESKRGRARGGRTPARERERRPDGSRRTGVLRMKKKTKREKKKLKWMPGSGRAQPGPAAAE